MKQRHVACVGFAFLSTRQAVMSSARCSKRLRASEAIATVSKGKCPIHRPNRSVRSAACQPVGRTTTLGGRHVSWVSWSILEAVMNSTRGRFDTCLFVEAPATDVYTSPCILISITPHMYILYIVLVYMSYADLCTYCFCHWSPDGLSSMLHIIY